MGHPARFIAQLTLVLFGASPVVAAPLAFPDVSGPTRASPGKFQGGIRHAFRKASLEVVDDEALANVESAGSDIMAARELGADYLLEVRIARAKGKFQAEATLTAAKDGTNVFSVKRTYKAKTQAWKEGRSLGWLVVKKIEKLRSAPAEVERPVVVPKDEMPAARSLEPKPDDDEAKAVAVIDGKGEREGHSDDKMLRASLAGGSQLSGAYTVAVAGQTTGLAYELKPTGLVAGEVLFNVPTTRLSAELGVAYVPMLYNIDVEPIVTPNQPGARHLDVAASLGYGFRFSLIAEDNVELRPILGLTYRSLAVQAQEPVDVLIGYQSIAPHGGLRAALRIGDLTMEALGLFRVVASYKEAPATTGEDGKGVSFLVGATARYWVIDNIGAYVNVGYDFTRVSLKGAGTRVGFKDDPLLVEATVFAEEIRLAFGVVAAI